jgi:hypothetical protein
MKIRICTGIVLTALLACRATAAGPRAAAPDAAAEASLRQAVQRQYRDFYNSAEPADQIALSKRLAHAATTAESPGQAYALLCEARDAAARAGDLAGGLRIAGAISSKFEVSDGSARIGVFTAGAAGMDGQQQDLWFTTLLTAIDQSLLADDFDAAKRMLDIGTATVAERQADFWSQPLAVRQADMDVQLKAYTAAKPAIEQMQKTPNDSNINLAVGKYECFVKGNWQAGLPLLDRGIDDQIQQAARMELWEPKNSAEQPQDSAKNAKVQITVADRWEALRASNPDAGTQLNLHAYDWYLRALPCVLDTETSDRSYVEGELARLLPDVESHRPNAAMWIAIADALSRKAIAQSPVIGGKAAADSFKDIPQDGGMLVGFHVGLAMLWGEKVITYVQPIYSTPTGERDGPAYGRQISKLQTLHAPAGYAIGAVRISGDTGLNSITAWYMRIAGNHLNTADRLKPVQLGGTGGTPATFGGRGTPIIGICGKQKDGVLGLGLVFARPANAAGPQSASVK